MQKLQLLQGRIDSPPQPLLTPHINPRVRSQIQHHQIAQSQRLTLTEVLIIILTLTLTLILIHHMTTITPTLITILTTLIISEQPLDFVIIQVTPG